VSEKPESMVRVPWRLLHGLMGAVYCNPLDNPGAPIIRPKQGREFMAAYDELAQDWCSPDGKHHAEHSEADEIAALRAVAARASEHVMDADGESFDRLEAALDKYVAAYADALTTGKVAP
jgi:hypothetical protein